MRPAQKPMWTDKDLAARFGNDPNYWAKLRCSGDGPEFLKIGKRCYYEPERFEAWLATKRRKSTSDPGPTTGSNMPRSTMPDDLDAARTREPAGAC